ncbi:MAG: hypothetical protein ACKO2K_14275 [Alphaproteobacteria bacterium]
MDGHRAGARRIEIVAGAFRLSVAAASLLACTPGPARAGTRVAGTILSVDAGKGEVVLDDAGHRLRLRLDGETKVREKGSDKSVADLHGGDRVVVSTDGDPPVARRIEVAGPAPAQSQSGAGGPAIPGFASGLDARSRPR